MKFTAKEYNHMIEDYDPHVYTIPNISCSNCGSPLEVSGMDNRNGFSYVTTPCKKCAAQQCVQADAGNGWQKFTRWLCGLFTPRR